MYYPQRAEPTVRQDKHKWDNQLEFLDRAFALNDRWGIAIDGGGFVGAWTREMSKRFDQVITFEPIPENWEACSRNNQKSNVYIYQCCLGENFNPIKLGMTGGNCFGQKALSKDQRKYPSMTIDSLELPIDFIKLDLDGCEEEAIEGARQTINEYHPLLVVEHKESSHLRTSFMSLKKLIKSFGYKCHVDTKKDGIWLYESSSVTTTGNQSLTTS